MFSPTHSTAFKPLRTTACSVAATAASSMAYIARRSEWPTSTHSTFSRFSIAVLTSPVCAPFSFMLTCWAPTDMAMRSDATIDATLRRSTNGGATTISACSAGLFFSITPICWPRWTASTKSRFIFQLPTTSGLAAAPI